MKTPFNAIAKAALILTYMVIVAGAVVRMTGSGMGCPDWPKCFGYYIPPTEIEQLQWQPNHDYKKDVVIILNEELFVAQSNFRSQDSIHLNNWKPYTKHDYATFNAMHTWVEYINRLLGALAGLATLVLGFYSLKYRRKHPKFVLLCWAVVVGMGFQAWLGKTVVDSNLSPFKITVHMIMALVIVAALLYVVFKTSGKNPKPKPSKVFTLILICAFLTTLIQITIGTQVRQFIDEQVKAIGYNPAYWLSNPTLSFYVHRSFSILVVGIHLLLFYQFKKYFSSFKLVPWILFIITLEVVSGIAMVYFNFPFSTQTLHLVFATVLFGLQFYLLLQIKYTPTKLQTL